MPFQVSDRRVRYILNKSENPTPDCLPFICKMMQSSKANESVSECSKTGLCIKQNVYRCCHEETLISKKKGKDQESTQSSTTHDP